MNWLVIFTMVVVEGSVSNWTSRLEPKIYRGYDVSIHQYSYAVFLHFKTTRPSSCGASLIMVQAVLTAAHCMDELRYKRGDIHANFGATIPKDAVVVRRVIDYQIHPKYRETHGKSNLAVALLDNRVPLMHEIKKVPLAAEDPAEVEVKVASVGWGKQNHGKLPDLSRYRGLKATQQRIITGSKCKKNLGLDISPKSLCTVPTIGHFYKDDAGNGLVLMKPSHILVGVLSYVSDDTSLL